MQAGMAGAGSGARIVSKHFMMLIQVLQVRTMMWGMGNQSMGHGSTVQGQGARYPTNANKNNNKSLTGIHLVEWSALAGLVREGSGGSF